MKYYIETISADLAETLKDRGMPIKRIIHPERAVTYGRVFDWLMENDLLVNIGGGNDVWRGTINMPIGYFNTGIKNTWHEAATAAIEKALELIKKD